MPCRPVGLWLGLLSWEDSRRCPISAIVVFSASSGLTSVLFGLPWPLLPPSSSWVPSLPSSGGPAASCHSCLHPWVFWPGQVPNLHFVGPHLYGEASTVPIGLTPHSQEVTCGQPWCLGALQGFSRYPSLSWSWSLFPAFLSRPLFGPLLGPAPGPAVAGGTRQLSLLFFLTSSPQPSSPQFCLFGWSSLILQ